MCGIVGLFCKSSALEPRLGELLSAMLVQMGERGPDSAGVAAYRNPAPPGLGHTRMATESRVTTAGSHPFSTGRDLCLVHNGSLSNHNRLRRELEREGMEFQTENDTEVAAAYLTSRLREGASLELELEGCL